MNAYRATDTTGSDMILRDRAADHSNMIGSRAAIATVASI